MKRYIRTEEIVNQDSLHIDYIVVVPDVRTMRLSQMPIVAGSNLFEDYDRYTIEELMDLDISEIRGIKSPYALDLIREAVNNGEFNYKLTRKQKEILHNFYTKRKNSDVPLYMVDVDELINAIRECNVLILPQYRTDQPEKNFAVSHNLPMQPDDYLAIIHEVSSNEIRGALKSSEEDRLGIVMYEFIHNVGGYHLKHSNEVITGNLDVYIKLIPNYNSKYTITVVSFHDPFYNAPTLMTTHGGGWGCLILDYGDSNE